MFDLRVMKRKLFKSLARMAPGCDLRLWLLRRSGYTIGKDVYLAEDVMICDELDDFVEKLVIGDRASIAPRVTFVLDSHPNASRLTEVMPGTHGRIVIGPDAWLGVGVCVMPNVTIGEGAVIGAGSVVTHDVPSWVVAAGVPARVLRAVPQRRETLDQVQP
jgi:maltose O-acetyltransferase